MNFFRKIIAIILPPKQGQVLKQQEESAEKKVELDLEYEYRKAVAGLDVLLKEEIHASHKEYEKEYDKLERRFEANGRKANPDFIALEKELDARYMGISTNIGKKYANLKEQLDIVFFDDIARIHFIKNNSSPKTGLTREQMEMYRKILTAGSKLYGGEDTATKLRSFFNEVMPILNEHKSNPPAK